MLDKIEQLKRLEPFNRKQIESVAGIYSFWWTGDLNLLKSLNRNVSLKGKHLKELDEEGNDFLKHDFLWDWNLADGPVCLYVGKSHNIAKRVDGHLCNYRTSESWYEPGHNQNFLVKHTTACQFRSGLEHLFKPHNGKTTLEEKLSHIGFSYLAEPSVTERFYLEDAAIGFLRPWFNVDSER